MKPSAYYKASIKKNAPHLMCNNSRGLINEKGNVQSIEDGHSNHSSLM
jgi:hypothetical protein